MNAKAIREAMAAIRESMAPNPATVEEHNACPACGECRVDCLGWDEDGYRVTCDMCGCVYDPAAN